MSYCRFRNTLLALRDCYYNLDDNSVSHEEFEARKQLIELCKSIGEEFDHKLEEEYGDVAELDEDDEIYDDIDWQNK